MKTQFKCQECNNVFSRWLQSERKLYQFCSTKCFQQNRKKKTLEKFTLNPRFCIFCNKQILFDINKKEGYHYYLKLKFCSRSCSAKYRFLQNPVQKGEKHFNFKGGVIFDIHGHRLILISTLPKKQQKLAKQMVQGNYIQEHRLVMALHLKRPLFFYEIIHHKNGNKTDNRIINLQLIIHPQKRFHSEEIQCPKCKFRFSLS